MSISSQLFKSKNRADPRIDRNGVDSEPLLNYHPASSSIQMSPFASGRPQNSTLSRCCYFTRKTKCFLIIILLGILTFFGYGLMFKCREAWCLPILRKESLTLITTTRPKLPEGDVYNLNDDVAKKLIVLNRQNVNSCPTLKFVDFVTLQNGETQFNVDESDVMVFLHIQKTGGTTFEKHLVNDIDLEAPCKCGVKEKKGRKGRKRKRKKQKQPRRCQCFRPGSANSSWLFSRYNTGWKCGLHADWTELTECVDSYLDSNEGVANRRYFYMSFIRDPVARFISEFLHVQRGATWKGSMYMCNGKPASSEDVPPCYESEDWSGVSLEDFISCSSNMAYNRQTRMLADLRLVGCYNKSAMAPEQREAVLLQSAKDNLEKMAFFGITSMQAKSQYLFEDTFNLKFKVNFEEKDDDQHSLSMLSELSQEMVDKVKRLNQLDIKLFEFAKDLMNRRYEEVKTEGPLYQSKY